MDTYYEEILIEVEKLMKIKDFKEAYALLEDELSMPYIPSEFEEKLISFYNECRSELELNKVQRTYHDEDIQTLLQGGLEEQFAAIELIKNSNIRKHLSEIETYLKSDDHHRLVRAYLIESLMEQNVTEEISMRYESLDVTFTPCYVENPLECEGIQVAVEQLRDWFENDNPSYLMMSMDTLVKEAYLRLPFSIDEEEGKSFALAVAKYVLEANDDKTGYERIIHEKELARSGGFELLLNKHDI